MHEQMNGAEANTPQMMIFLKPLDAPITKIRFSFFPELGGGGLGHSGGGRANGSGVSDVDGENGGGGGTERTQYAPAPQQDGPQCPDTAVGYPPTAVRYPPTAVGYPPTGAGYSATAV